MPSLRVLGHQLTCLQCAGLLRLPHASATVGYFKVSTQFEVAEDFYSHGGI